MPFDWSTWWGQLGMRLDAMRMRTQQAAQELAKAEKEAGETAALAGELEKAGRAGLKKAARLKKARYTRRWRDPKTGKYRYQYGPGGGGRREPSPEAQRTMRFMRRTEAGHPDPRVTQPTGRTRSDLLWQQQRAAQERKQKAEAQQLRSPAGTREGTRVAKETTQAAAKKIAEGWAPFEVLEDDILKPLAQARSRRTPKTAGLMTTGLNLARKTLAEETHLPAGVAKKIKAEVEQAGQELHDFYTGKAETMSYGDVEDAHGRFYWGLYSWVTGDYDESVYGEPEGKQAELAESRKRVAAGFGRGLARRKAREAEERRRTGG